MYAMQWFCTIFCFVLMDYPCDTVVQTANEGMDRRTDLQTDGRSDGQIDVRKYGWTNGGQSGLFVENEIAIYL